MKKSPEPESVSDPVQLMLGVGQQLWKRESGDAFVERLRAEDVQPPPPPQI